MLRQAVTSSSRALRTAVPRLQANKAVLRPQLRTAPTPLFTLRVAQPAASRWYSDAKEAPAEEAKKGEGEAEADPLAELKKSLEAKDAEAREWKVRTPLTTGPRLRIASFYDAVSGRL
jgi:molecular chaperone GrpE